MSRHGNHIAFQLRVQCFILDVKNSIYYVICIFIYAKNSVSYALCSNDYVFHSCITPATRYFSGLPMYALGCFIYLYSDKNYLFFYKQAPQLKIGELRNTSLTLSAQLRISSSILFVRHDDIMSNIIRGAVQKTGRY
jgi:hypothetical protein